MRDVNWFSCQILFVFVLKSVVFQFTVSSNTHYARTKLDLRRDRYPTLSLLINEGLQIGRTVSATES